jgi:hypothetical protein
MFVYEMECTHDSNNVAFTAGMLISTTTVANEAACSLLCKTTSACYGARWVIASTECVMYNVGI